MYILYLGKKHSLHLCTKTKDFALQKTPSDLANASLSYSDVGQQVGIQASFFLSLLIFSNCHFWENVVGVCFLFCFVMFDKIGEKLN